MRAVSSCILCAVAALATAPAADAAWPGRNDAIAVIWNEFDRGGANDTELRLVTDGRRDLGTSLWLANANGSAPTVLLAGGEQPVG